jgi:hypothetical protein
MEPSCPKCSKSLPEVETLEFRFCPHCGAEIAAESQQLDDAYLTIPPDSLPPQDDHRPTDLSPETEKTITVAGPFDDQTSELQPMAGRQKPKLTPPVTPPPASFFRTRSDEKTPSIRSEEKLPPKTIRSEEKLPPKKGNKKTSPTKNRNIFIAILVILVMIILILGGLFTF